MKKPLGIYLISTVDGFLGIGLLVPFVMLAFNFVASTLNSLGQREMILIGDNVGNPSELVLSYVFLGIVTLLGVIFLSTAYSTFHLKKRALWERWVVSTSIVIFTLFIYVTWSIIVESFDYAEGHTEGNFFSFLSAASLVGFTLALLYAFWNIYYFHRPTIKGIYIY